MSTNTEPQVNTSEFIAAKSINIIVEDQFRIKETDKKTYCGNNGVLAFVDGNGKYHAAPSRDDLVAALEGEGYQKNTLFVPFSNGEKPVDGPLPNNLGAAAKWDQLIREADAYGREQERKENLATYEKKAKEREITPVIGDYIICDGVTTTNDEKIETNETTEGLRQRIDHVGTYSSNNGTTAFVDGQGHLCAAPSSELLFITLKASGYKKGEMFVPFSNGELPENKSLQNKWKALQGKSK